MELKTMIKMHEGLRLKPYLCSEKKVTIGYGRNLDDRGISQQEAEKMLERDIDLARHDLWSIFGSRFNMFSVNRQSALIDMMFNLGMTRFKGFKLMIEAINENDWDEASRQALDSKWVGQVGSRAIEDATLLKEG